MHLASREAMKWAFQEGEIKEDSSQENEKGVRGLVKIGGDQKIKYKFFLFLAIIALV